MESNEQNELRSKIERLKDRLQADSCEGNWTEGGGIEQKRENNSWTCATVVTVRGARRKKKRV